MRSLQRIRLTKWIPVVFVILGPLATCKATIIAEYNFLNDGNHIHDLAPASPNYDLDAQPNGTGFASANLYGTTPIGTRLGQAGLMTEPTEPTSQDNNYGFWAPKTLISSLPNWTVLLWFNRQDFANVDMLFYVGAGDGFSGTGAETYVFGTAAGSLAAQNYRDNSTIDWNANGGSIAPLGWHQAGIVRNGSSMSLYLDGSLLNTTPERDAQLIQFDQQLRNRIRRRQMDGTGISTHSGARRPD